MDGITPQAPAGLTLRVGSRAGSDALAVDVTTLTEVLFSVPICNTAAIDFSDRRLSYDVFFEGGNPQGEQYFVQTSVPSNDLANAQLGLQNIQAGVNVVVTGLFSDSMFSDQANQFTVQAGTFGAAFSGTIWFDNFRIE